LKNRAIFAEGIIVKDSYAKKGCHPPRDLKTDGAVQMAVERVETHLSLLLLADNKRSPVLLKPFSVGGYSVLCLLRSIPATMHG